MLDAATIYELCAAATRIASEHDEVAELAQDDLDHSIWVRLRGEASAQAALAALTDHGLAASQYPSHRVRVTGWDARLLRRRLGMLLAGVDDLTGEWTATSELARYHYDRRAQASGGLRPEEWEVLAEVEAAMRRAVPIPRRAPAVHDIDQLHTLIEAAEDAYQQLIARHIDYAETTLRDCRVDQRDAAPRP